MSLLPPQFDFGFTIVDDTDHSTLENAKPLYDLLSALGFRTTKTVWALPPSDPDNAFVGSGTLADAAYADWVRSLQDDGFEIAFHGASGGSNPRQQTLDGIERFNQVLGSPPAMHINHHRNMDNLYWGRDRINSRLGKLLVRFGGKAGGHSFDGHRPDSPYYWGDVASKHIRYCRNLTFHDTIDVLEVNPTTPYHDTDRPCVPWWFSSVDAGDVDRFCALLTPANLQLLKQRRGVAILYIHTGNGFVVDGEVVGGVRERLEAVRDLGQGALLPAGALLDLLRGGSTPAERQLGRRERARMERRWLAQKIMAGGTS